MRRAFLGILVVALLAPAAGAVTGGMPDSAQITSITGSVQVNGTGVTAPYTLSSSTGYGTADKITLSGLGASVEVTFLFNSKQIAYARAANGTINLAIVLGTPELASSNPSYLPATDAGNGIQILDVAWSTDGGTSFTPSPSPYSLGPTGVSGGHAAGVWLWSLEFLRARERDRRRAHPLRERRLRLELVLPRDDPEPGAGDPRALRPGPPRRGRPRRAPPARTPVLSGSPRLFTTSGRIRGPGAVLRRSPGRDAPSPGPLGPIPGNPLTPRTRSA
jgi:hypothetical protein